MRGNPGREKISTGLYCIPNLFQSVDRGPPDLLRFCTTGLDIDQNKVDTFAKGGFCYRIPVRGNWPSALGLIDLIIGIFGALQRGYHRLNLIRMTAFYPTPIDRGSHVVIRVPTLHTHIQVVGACIRH